SSEMVKRPVPLVVCLGAVPIEPPGKGTSAKLAPALAGPALEKPESVAQVGTGVGVRVGVAVGPSAVTEAVLLQAVSNVRMSAMNIVSHARCRKGCLHR